MGRETYIIIQNYMVTELQLSGNELLVYALINGFSQDCESEFRGSLNYICNWLNCTKSTAQRALRNLEDNGLITKRVILENKQTYNRYKIAVRGSQNEQRGSQNEQGGVVKMNRGGVVKMTPHNIVLDNIDSINISFDKFWNLYDKKVGDIEKLTKKWHKLTDSERITAINHISKYKLATPDKQFRKNPESYLNNKSFNDEIIGIDDNFTLSENPNALELENVMCRYSIILPEHIKIDNFQKRVEYVRQIISKTNRNVSNLA